MTLRSLACAALLVALVRTARAQADPLAARTKGRADAPVTVFEMSDFQCPFCRGFALETMPALDSEYVRTGKIRFIYVNFPLTRLHPNAQGAAELAVCAARQGKFWPMHDLLFRHQPEWAGLAKPLAYFIALGDSAGLDRARLTRCITSRAAQPEVDADAASSTNAGASATPTFYVEKLLVSGAAPLAVFRHLLDSLYQAKTGAR
ncbi:MAG TPA: thioredoxin domain-containing protein [Gemmatimonadales bacterium]|nr:thioredoxin domain-containing protein [Gemmatimonadales bacterium]